ncbi:ABC transporter substrate-binding protein [Methanogenium organophilum]|uniref:ABC transporter substrate-binding protein n=1 Tax=Methanogenium organophilum TaxID=2199 RepID=A0A9X9S4I8_METOG|nr:ABC transporter substrate-binding protein [Methanogenium organophilum]WAI01333.1 ABC transporter substrate-binding protein [Methanogenium organophilum]
MNKRLLSVFVICMALLCVAFAGCTSSEAATGDGQGGVGEKSVYSVGIDVPYPPFSKMDTDGNPTGFDVDSIRWIAENQGFEVKFEVVAWDGIIPALQAGQIDMVYSGMTITDERLEKVNFSIPYWTVNQMVVVVPGSGVTIDDIKEGNAIIGTQSGCTAAIWMEENLIDTGIMAKENLKVYPDTTKAVDDLTTGRIDAVMYDDLSLKDIIGGRDVENIGSIETNEEFGIAVRKDDTELLNKLNAGLTNLMADPYWEELKVQYDMVV